MSCVRNVNMAVDRNVSARMICSSISRACALDDDDLGVVGVPLNKRDRTLDNQPVEPE